MTTKNTPKQTECKYAAIKPWRERLEAKYRFKQSNEPWLDLGGEG